MTSFDDALGDAPGGLGQRVVGFRVGRGELVEAATEPGDGALPFEPADGGGGDAGAAEVGQARDAALAQDLREALALGGGLHDTIPRLMWVIIQGIVSSISR